MTRPLPHRGAALLLVLATLVLAVTGSVTFVQLATTTQAHRAFVRRSVIADDLLGAVEPPILDWLVSESGRVVLPPDATTPEVNVLHDLWVTDGVEYELEVTGWDQCGMVPIERSGSPLRRVLSGEVRAALDRTTLPEDHPPGLDLFLHTAGEPVRAFPSSRASISVVFGTIALADDATPGRPRGESSVPAIGESVATHNSNVINVNTASIDLVEAALRLAGRGGIELVVEARSEGRTVTLNDLPAPLSPHRSAPRLAAGSNAWAFRIDIRVGSLRRSWWSVYEKGRSSQWECAQRLAIPE